MRDTMAWIGWTAVGVLVAQAWPRAEATSCSVTYVLDLRRVDASCVYPEEEGCGFPVDAVLEVHETTRGVGGGSLDLGDLGVVELSEAPSTDGEP